ncbi:MAG: DUF1015 domain-containing protein [Spirochaetaceae bacterium]|jgi:hypothetical protein|nr:DUF1015 domain-containing protein [Spirochaetaceae bacterium]
MVNPHQRLAALGTAIPEIIFPGPETDPEKWAVIACDQFTQDREYWNAVRRTVGDAPSALDLIFPEVYLGDPDREERIRRIHRSMDRYLGDGALSPPRRCAVYIERSTPRHPRRRGLLLAVDLERYDWTPGARFLIRSTEGTVPERLPPRMEVRRGAALEIPHILLLIDDDEDALLPALGERAGQNPPRYESPLMFGAGSVKGWTLDRESDWDLLAGGLEALARRAGTRYGRHDPEPFLFAVGDGNHSLATAKAVWEEYKAAHRGEPVLAEHGARWALVEVENLYDPAVGFEPIHRILFGVRMDEILGILSRLPGFSARSIGKDDAAGARRELSRLVGDPGAGGNRLGLISGGELTLVESDAPGLATDSLQPLLDAFIAADKNPDKPADAGKAPVSIDYIHGEEELFRLAGPGSPAPALGILLPPIRKTGLFETVARSGPLPRKSFSMGEAGEKRFYFEARKLFPR